MLYPAMMSPYPAVEWMWENVMSTVERKRLTSVAPLPGHAASGEESEGESRDVGQECSVCCTARFCGRTTVVRGRSGGRRLSISRWRGWRLETIPRVEGVYFMYHPGIRMNTCENCTREQSILMVILLLEYYFILVWRGSIGGRAVSAKRQATPSDHNRRIAGVAPRR
ncbi:hypothetical protein VTN96DRAFT_801 [Rasamsonia emersonii]